MKTLARPGDKEEILRRLRTVRPDAVRRFGRMSASQMIYHLSDAFQMGMGRKAVSPATGLPQRTVVKWIALYLPLRWPGGRIVTRPEIDQEGAGTRPGDFATDVAELEAMVDILTSRAGTVQWPPHPIFGRMSEADWMRWGYLHTDHHLRQFGA